MALQMPSNVPLTGFARAAHEAKVECECDPKTADLLMDFLMTFHGQSRESVTTFVEVTFNRLIQSLSTLTNAPIGESSFRLKFTLRGAEISIETEKNWIFRMVTGDRKKALRKHLEVVLRPVLMKALAPYPLPNRAKYVAKLEKKIALEYLNMVNDRRIDLRSGSGFIIERV
jgi:hypothetical protein